MFSKDAPESLAGNLWRNGQVGKAGSFAGTRNLPIPETTGERLFAERTGFSGSVFDQVRKLSEPKPRRPINNPFQMTTADGSTLTTESAPGVANIDFFKAQAHKIQNRLARANPNNAHRGPLTPKQLGLLQASNPLATRRYQGLSPDQQQGVMIEGTGDDTIIYVPGEGWSNSANQIDKLPNLPQGIREIFVAGQGGSFGGLLGIDQKPDNWYLFGGAIDLGSPEMPGAGTASTWWVPDRILWSDMSDFYDYHDKNYYGSNGYDVTLGDLDTIFTHEWNSFLKGMEGHLDKGDPLGMALQFVYSGATTVVGLGSAVWNSLTGAFSSPGDAMGILASPQGAAGLLKGIVPGGCFPGGGAGGGSGSPAGPLQDIVNGGCFGSNLPPVGGGAPASSGVEGLLVTFVSKADAAMMDAQADAARKTAIENGQKAKDKADAEAKAKEEAAKKKAEEEAKKKAEEEAKSSSDDDSDMDGMTPEQKQRRQLQEERVENILKVMDGNLTDQERRELETRNKEIADELGYGKDETDEGPLITLEKPPSEKEQVDAHNEPILKRDEELRRASELETAAQRKKNVADVVALVDSDKAEELRNDAKQMELEAAKIREGEKGVYDKQRQQEAGEAMREFTETVLDKLELPGGKLPNAIKDVAGKVVTAAIDDGTETLIETEQDFNDWLRNTELGEKLRNSEWARKMRERLGR